MEAHRVSDHPGRPQNQRPCRGLAARGVRGATAEAVLIVDRAGVQCANALAHRLLGDEAVIGLSAAWSRRNPECSDTEDTARTSFVARATGVSLRRTSASLPDVDGLSLIVLTAVSTAETAYPVRDPMERLNEVEAISHLVSWSWDIEADVVSWSDELYRIHGLAPQSMPMSYGSFLELVHPVLPVHPRGGRGTLLPGGASPMSPPIGWSSPMGGCAGIRGEAGVVMSDGRPVRMFGTGQDVTDRVLGQRRFVRASKRHVAWPLRTNVPRAELEVQVQGSARVPGTIIAEAAYQARRRLERDLHDGAQQRLTLVEMTLRAAVRQLGASTDPTLRSTLDQA